MPIRKHPLYGQLALVALLLFVFALGIAVARPQDTGDKKAGKTFIHILKQDKKEIWFQPIVPAIFVGRLDNGQLNGEKLFECDVWEVKKISEAGKYPVVELHCGAVLLTLVGVDMIGGQQ